MRDDDSEMEMEFLLPSFSDLSDESIRDVYLANNGDLDATIEMLTQLEMNMNIRKIAGKHTSQVTIGDSIIDKEDKTHNITHGNYLKQPCRNT
ncbi:unnamed protein product [Brassica rapa]|uniref:CUE domain-containing protein n=1 Tax=Brassica campestris TaxID=3711 RepID=A0A8D9M3R1_BRACM|nr:unnamed protein product [Brassica rapa]